MLYDDKDNKKVQKTKVDVKTKNGDVDSKKTEKMKEILEETASFSQTEDNVEFVEGDEFVDKLQKKVWEAGEAAVSLLSEKELLTKLREIDSQKIDETLHKTKLDLKDLKNFRYNIGFAGPQSCGKSSLINAIIQYPLMPTCKLATTCTPVELIYSKEIRIVVKDEDKNGKIILDKKCAKLSQKDFNLLKNYACKVNKVAPVENLQFFGANIKNEINVRPDQLDMVNTDPKQVALLLLIILTVYVSQNSEQKTADSIEINQLREETMSKLGMPKKLGNISVIIQWDNPMLASGLMITDLPGLGSDAVDKEVNGKLLKGHDTITKEAIYRTDTMAFLSEPLVQGAAVPALEAMMSNAAMRDAVSADERVVAIMNKADCFDGDAEKKAALDRMIIMMQNAGVNMTGKKIWETISLYGEYTYDGFDVEKSVFVQNQISKMRNAGFDDEDIEMQIPLYKKQLKKGYERSGIDELREFFRTSFVATGKYQKVFAAIMALKVLASNMAVPIRTQIDADMILADVSMDIAAETLDKLKEAATTPLNEAQEKTAQEVERMIGNQEIVSTLLNGATSQYMNAFEEGIDEYQKRLKKIADQFSVGLLSNKARIDSGNSKNNELYNKMLNESKRMDVNLTKVNNAYAKTLQYCNGEIEKIYFGMQERLKVFRNTYPDVLGKFIDGYRGVVDKDIVKLMESMLPVVLDFVDAKIETADVQIKNKHNQFKKVGDELALELIDLNDDFVRVLLKMVSDKLDTIEGGWFVKKEFILVDGSNGLKNTLNNLGLNYDDKKLIESEITNAGLQKIRMPLLGWYTDAQTDVNQIMSSLAIEIVQIFGKLEKQLEDNAEATLERIEDNKKLLERLQKIFAKLQNDIQPQIEEMLKAGIHKEYEMLKDDFYGKVFKAEA